MDVWDAPSGIRVFATSEHDGYHFPYDTTFSQNGTRATFYLSVAVAKQHTSRKRTADTSRVGRRFIASSKHASASSVVLPECSFAGSIKD
jgi:hypothetical protein